MRKITFVNLQTFYKFCDLADADGIHFRAYEQADGSFQVKMGEQEWS